MTWQELATHPYIRQIWKRIGLSKYRRFEGKKLKIEIRKKLILLGLRIDSANLFSNLDDDCESLT
jgi:hypothetical protein